MNTNINDRNGDIEQTVMLLRERQVIQIGGVYYKVIRVRSNGKITIKCVGVVPIDTTANPKTLQAVQNNP